MSDFRKQERITKIHNEVKELHPLLSLLLKKLPRVNRVEYTHGVTEHGADFVLCQADELLGTPVYIGVVAKIGTISKNDAHDIIKQVRECAGERLFFSGQQKIKLHRVWIVTNGEIKPAAKRLIHDEFPSSHYDFFDRDHLITLVDNHLSSYWSDVVVAVGDYLSELLTFIKRKDSESSLWPGFPEDFYIPQEFGRFRRRPRELLFDKKRNLPKLEKVDIFKEIKDSKAVVLEGDAGSGKSKCLRQIAKHFTDSETYLADHIVPILTTLRELSLTSYDLKKVIEEKSVLFPDLFDQPKQEILFLVDAADELKLTAEESFKQLQNLIDQVVSSQNWRIVIATRPIVAANNTSYSLTNSKSVDILLLTLTSMVSFLKKLCVKIAPSNRVFEDLKSSMIFKQLPRSPIAAILLARILNETSEDLPSSLPELYDKFTQLMLGKWEIDKGLRGEKEQSAIDSVLRDIASYMLENQLPSLSIAEARGFFSAYTGKRNLPFTDRELFDAVCSRCAIISIDEDEGTFSFRHRSFMEFFFAKSIVGRRGNVSIIGKAFDLL